MHGPMPPCVRATFQVNLAAVDLARGSRWTQLPFPMLQSLAGKQGFAAAAEPSAASFRAWEGGGYTTQLLCVDCKPYRRAQYGHQDGQMAGAATSAATAATKHRRRFWQAAPGGGRCLRHCQTQSL